MGRRSLRVAGEAQQGSSWRTLRGTHQMDRECTVADRGPRLDKDIRDCLQAFSEKYMQDEQKGSNHESDSE